MTSMLFYVEISYQAILLSETELKTGDEGRRNCLSCQNRTKIHKQYIKLWNQICQKQSEIQSELFHTCHNKLRDLGSRVKRREKNY